MELLQPQSGWHQRMVQTRTVQIQDATLQIEGLILSNMEIFAGFVVFIWVLMLDLKWKRISYRWSRKQTVEKLRCDVG